MLPDNANVRDDNSMPDIARRIFERAALFQSQKQSQQQVTAAQLAAHVAFESGKSYVPKNIKKALCAANLQPHVTGKGQLGDKWIYEEILPFLRDFSKGRAKGVNWPDDPEYLNAEKIPAKVPAKKGR